MFEGKKKTCIYTDSLIYSPSVPFFMDTQGELLPKPYLSAIISCPAPNAGIARKRGVSEQNLNDKTVNRMRKVLAVALKYRHKRIVLGAWGCGCFKGNIDFLA